MTANDTLHALLVEFFQLPPTTPANKLTQESVAQWDSLASVQLIAEVQSTFHIEFDLMEIETLVSYEKIRESLLRKNVRL